MHEHTTDSLTARLRLYAESAPERIAFTFLLDGEREDSNWTFGALYRAARLAASELRTMAEPGARAVLVHPTGPEFFVAFLGCLYAGLVAVPAAPPRPNQPLGTLDALARDCGAAVVVTTADLLTRVRRRLDAAPYLSTLRWAAELGGRNASAKDHDSQTIDDGDPDSLAYLQYTSGSTGTPSGVMISHGNLVHNLRMIEAATRADGTPPIFLSWLPLFHDLGLVGSLASLYRGTRCVLLSPLHVIQKPLRWLQAIGRYQATISGGPNFIYDLCASKIVAPDRAALDLHSWTAAFVAAEPIRAQTLRRFADLFAAAGFRWDAFRPSYGLAEATVLVTTGDSGAVPLVRRFDDMTGGRELVGCGHSWLGQRVAIVDPESGTLAPPDQAGEIWVSGPGVGRGYWNRPDETAHTFGGALQHVDGGPFLRTGDLGFLVDHELFITGRLKDLVIIRGHNYYPQDIESAAERAHAGLVPNAGAVFSLDVDGEERLIVVHELVRQAHPEDGAAIIATVRNLVALEHGIRPHAVVLLKPAGMPRTTSGKVQRRQCREQLMAGTLNVAIADYGEPDCRGIPG